MPSPPLAIFGGKILFLLPLGNPSTKPITTLLVAFKRAIFLLETALSTCQIYYMICLCDRICSRY